MFPSLAWTFKRTSFPRFTSGVVTHNSCEFTSHLVTKWLRRARPALSLSSLRNSRPSSCSSCRCPDSSRLSYFHLGYERGATHTPTKRSRCLHWLYLVPELQGCTKVLNPSLMNPSAMINRTKNLPRQICLWDWPRLDPPRPNKGGA